MAKRPKSDLDLPEERFWETKALADMSKGEWESLCDGCGKCCLLKLEDADTGETYFTDVACKLLDPATCQCSDYARRKMFVPDCIVLSPETLDQVAHWLPPTCAYRLLSEGRPLYDWHPLVSCDAKLVHRVGASCSHRVISEDDIADEDLPERIVDWANVDPGHYKPGGFAGQGRVLDPSEPKASWASHPERSMLQSFDARAPVPKTRP